MGITKGGSIKRVELLTEVYCNKTVLRYDIMSNVV